MRYNTQLTYESLILSYKHKDFEMITIDQPKPHSLLLPCSPAPLSTISQPSLSSRGRAAGVIKNNACIARLNKRDTRYAIRDTRPSRPPNKPPILPNLTCWQFTTFLCKTNPIFTRPTMNLTPYLKRNYEKYSPLRTAKNKPKQTQFKANSNPISAQTNPIQTQNKPNQTQFRSAAETPAGSSLGSQTGG